MAIQWLTQNHPKYGVSNFEAILQNPRHYFEWHAPQELSRPQGYPIRQDPAVVREIVLSPQPNPNHAHGQIINLRMPNKRVPNDIFADFLGITGAIPADSFYYHDPNYPGNLIGRHPNFGITTPRPIRAICSAMHNLSQAIGTTIPGHKVFLMNFNKPWLPPPQPQRLYIAYLG